LKPDWSPLLHASHLRYLLLSNRVDM